MSNLTKKILLYSPQGGTGKSVIAANTAIFASEFRVRTLLIDLSVFGSISSLLRLHTKSQNNISLIVDEIIQNGDLSDEIFSNNLIKILNGNLFVIQNCNVTKMLKLTSNIIHKILQKSSKFGFDLVIIDTSSDLTKKNFYLFENVDHIIIPTIQDMGCTWKVLQFKELINKAYMKNIKLSTILNMCNKSSGFNNSKYELETGIKNIYQLPHFSKNFQSYLNQGYMLNSSYNKVASNDFLELTKKILIETGIKV